MFAFFFFSSRRRHTRWPRDWSSDVCSSDLLSGGGFRATLFHIGAIRRLNEFGILPKLTTVSSVSGGSILNGFLATRLSSPLRNGIADFDSGVSKPVRQFCSLDIRRCIALEVLLPGTHNRSG